MLPVLGELMDKLRHEVRRVADGSVLEPELRTQLSELLIDAIHCTLRELVAGAESEEFQELVLINFIVISSQAGHENNAIRAFVHELRTLDK